MGLPSTPEGEQAKKSMETRQSQAKTAIQDLVEKICAEAIVFLASGNKVQSGTWRKIYRKRWTAFADRQVPRL